MNARSHRDYCFHRCCVGVPSAPTSTCICLRCSQIIVTGGIGRWNIFSLQANGVYDLHIS